MIKFNNNQLKRASDVIANSGIVAFGGLALGEFMSEKGFDFRVFTLGLSYFIISSVFAIWIDHYRKD